MFTRYTVRDCPPSSATVRHRPPLSATVRHRHLLRHLLFRILRNLLKLACMTMIFAIVVYDCTNYKWSCSPVSSGLIIRWLNNLSSSSGVFIPVTSLVLDVLEYKISKDSGNLAKSCNQ
ncbi:hypothetical protein ACSQ67_016940 [Phaseolus vulgaris]